MLLSIFIIVITQKLVLQQSKNVTAKCTETLSPPVPLRSDSEISGGGPESVTGVRRSCRPPPLYSPLDTHIKWKFLLIGLKNETLTYSKALIYIYLFKRVLWHSLIMALRFGESLTLTSTKHGWSFYLFITLCSIIRTQSTTMFGMGLRRF